MTIFYTMAYNCQTLKLSSPTQIYKFPEYVYFTRKTDYLDRYNIWYEIYNIIAIANDKQNIVI